MKKYLTTIILLITLLVSAVFVFSSCETEPVLPPAPVPSGEPAITPAITPPGAYPSSMIPTANNSFDIGKATKQWRHFYLYGNIFTSDGSGNLTLPTSTTTLVGTDTTDTLTNKSLTSPTITGTVSGNATYTNPTISTISNNGTLTLPADTSDTMVGRATTDTLTNKTLTSPTIGGTSVVSNRALPESVLICLAGALSLLMVWLELPPGYF